MVFGENMVTTRVKVCGFTDVAEARDAAFLGVDAIGLVFFVQSPRHVSVARAQEIVAALPPFVSTVGLFVNERAEHIHAICEQVSLSVLQFHGDESAEQCRQLGMPYLKAIRVRKKTDILAACDMYHDACGLLCDAWVKDTMGGTGQTFDWSMIPADLPLPLVLSGGLHAGNVARAIRAVNPWAVDVSSGVESSPGQKDRQKIAQFMMAVKG